MSSLLAQSTTLFGPSSQWMSEAIQPFPAAIGGATSLSHQDSPPTYDAAMAASCDAGRWINPS